MVNDLFSILTARAAGDLPAAKPLLPARFESQEFEGGFQTMEEERIAAAPAQTVEPVQDPPPEATEPRTFIPPRAAPALISPVLAVPEPDPQALPTPPPSTSLAHSERHTRELRTILERAIEVAPSPQSSGRAAPPTFLAAKPADALPPRATAEPLRTRDAEPQAAPQMETRQSAPSITITIGKIEVKGPPQPAPRPLSRPALARPTPRVSVSLRDYLSTRGR